MSGSIGVGKARGHSAGVLALLACAAIWGMSFVAQTSAMRYLPPLTFNAIRFGVGCLLCAAIARSLGQPSLSRRDVSFACVLGATLFLAISCQQLAIAAVGAARTSFIMGLQVILVPFLFAASSRHRVRPMLWVSAIVALIGLSLVTDAEMGSIRSEDGIVVLSAVFISMSLVLAGKFSGEIPGWSLAAVQNFTIAGLSAVAAFILDENPDQGAIAAAWKELLFMGILANGIAYAAQFYGQRRVSAPEATLLINLSSIFALLAGWSLLGEQLPSKQLVGCGIIFSATVLSQLPGVLRTIRLLRSVRAAKHSGV